MNMEFINLIGFVNNGTDDEILKSLEADNVSEDMIKAMNKQGLVQKEVQVKGKNGQTFTRKQWVKAGEETKPTKSVGNTAYEYNGRHITSIPDGFQPPYHGGETYYFEVHPPKGSRYNVKKYFKTREEAEKYIDSEANKTDDATKTPSTIKAKGVSELLDKMEDAGFKMDFADRYDLEYSSRPSNEQFLHKDGKEYIAYFNIYSDGGCEFVGIKPTGKESNLDKPSEPNKKDKTDDKKPKDDTSKQKSNKTGKQQLEDMLSSGKSRADIMSEFEKQGVTWKKNDHAGINWMRAAMAIQKHLEGNAANANSSDSSSKNADNTPSKYEPLPTETPDSIKTLYSKVKKSNRVNATHIFDTCKKTIEKTGTLSRRQDKTLLRKAVEQVATDNAFQYMMDKYSGYERDVVFEHIGFYIKNSGYGTSGNLDKVLDSVAKKHGKTLNEVIDDGKKMYEEFTKKYEGNLLHIVDNEFKSVSKDLVSDTDRKYMSINSK